MRFIRFSEYNDHEGESWNWWLQVDGNDNELDKLAEMLLDASEIDDEFPFKLHLDDVEHEEVVDKLFEYAGDGYYAAHNKVVGKFRCPDSIGNGYDDDFGCYEWDGLYKGGIKDFFERIS